MANEFIVRKGIVSLGDIQVSGSISATGTVTISGSIASSSYASNSERLDNLDSTAFVFTSSYNTDSSSLSSRVTKIEGNYATTGSNIFMGAQTVCANITSTGTIIAQTLNVQQVTSSIVYSSGSNTFGCALTDVQQMTGSLRVTGSNAVFNVGCVGIGTSSPSFLLSTQGTGDLRMYNLNSGNTSGDRSVIQAEVCGDTSGNAFFAAGKTGVVWSFGRNTTTGNFEVRSNFDLANDTQSRFQITSTGIACFACQVCAATVTSAGTINGTTIYGSTAICGAVICGGATTLTGALSGTSATFSGVVKSTANFIGTDLGSGGIYFSGDASPDISYIGYNYTNVSGTQSVYQASRSSWRQHFGNGSTNQWKVAYRAPDAAASSWTDYLTIASTGAATFSSSVTAGSILLTKGSITNDTGYGTGFNVIGSATTYIGSSTGIVGFVASNAEGMRLTSTGLGIGTTTINDKLDVYGNIRTSVNTSYYSVSNYLGINYYLGSSETVDNIDFKINGGGTFTSGGNFRFWTQTGNTTPVERMRITSGGNVRMYNSVGIGLNSGTDASTRLHIKRADSSGMQEILRLDTGNDANNDGSYINWTTGDGGTQVARIGGQRAGTDIGHILFETGNGSNGYTERMRISCNGAVYINTDSNQLANATPALGILAGTTCDAVNIKHLQNGNNAVNIWQTGTSQFGAIVFYKGNTQDERGNITVSTTGTAFNSVSDYRLKENVTPSTCGLDRLMQLKPSKFNWIQTGEEAEGFIAHELQEVFPDAVTGEKDGVYSSTGNIRPQSVDYGRITPLLVKAIQEQQSQICTQASTITQLKTCLGII